MINDKKRELNALTVVDLLKKNNEDFEFYPTTKEMIKTIYESFRYRYNRVRKDPIKILDIGCGTCNLKKHIKSFDEYLDFKYFVIEKSKILIDMLDEESMVLGTDFHRTTLIDKKVDIVFCNPPYSEFEIWTKKIISDCNCDYVYMIIPSRWKENKEIMSFVENYEINYSILDVSSFHDAERQARANVDIVLFNKKTLNEKQDPFTIWFDRTFKTSEETIENTKPDYSIENTVKNSLVDAEDKIETLLKLYNNELEKLICGVRELTKIDIKILNDVGISKNNIISSLKEKMTGLKATYWKLAFESLEEIKSRLNYENRSDMWRKFSEHLTVDFNIYNIYSVILWVIKNAHLYCDNQLTSLFKKLSYKDNVTNYKSNQKIFKDDGWRHMNDEYSHYTLDYRIICEPYVFKNIFNWSNKISENYLSEALNQFILVANNLGFSIGEIEIAKETGKSQFIYFKNGEVFLEYKIYKNGNTHIRLNQEFAKAFNVEASRLLGWIRSKADIKKEFPKEMAEGAEKYFKQNTAISLSSNNIKLLAAS